MDAQRLHDLVEAYLERRLSGEGRAALNQSLRDSADSRRLFWEQVHQHALLAELLAETRGRHLAAEEAEILAGTRALVCPAEARQLLRPRWRLALAAALVFVAGLTWLLQPASKTPSVPEDAATPTLAARLIDLHGEVFVGDEQARVPAWAGQTIRPGQEVHTGEASSAVVRYADASRIELHGDTAVRLLARLPGDSTRADKHIFLVKGAVNANVAPGTSGRPLSLRTSQADLLSTRGRFSSTSVLGETRIEMEEGNATLARTGEQRGIEIRSGTYAVAATEPEVYRPAPMLPKGSEPAAVLVESSGPVLCLAVLRDGPTLAYACGNGQIKLWNVVTRKQRGVLGSPHRKAVALSVAPDGRTLAAGYEPAKNVREGAAFVWDTRKGKRLHTLDGIRRVQGLTFTPDGRTLAVATGEKNTQGLLVWDLGDSRERLQLGERLVSSLSVALSPDGHTLAAGGRDGIIRLYDINTGRPAGLLGGHTREVQSLAFGPGGAILASGSRDGTVRLWSVGDGNLLRTLTGKFNEVRCLSFSPDGQTLASGHAGIALLWNVATGGPRTALRAHKFAISAILYLPDGRTLATAGWDRTIKLWDLQPAGSD